ncbi:repeat domain in Vibrio, Colwellia, Bradyrhizobium and Shewanella [Kordia sp. SMS9]|uniref:VCBS repeat-containing protein n=1 Tax=Kordia sp. SMS9 TaxID=2282170 RepID=UPI000E0D2CE3|nr:VCBS repeat-containing protein [Kordia sp. SMS9]AXG72422.1 repeat domain in Vibrio, Colwellia, Bradyrhizobium and Shewanella [Kordia sp. SMS9]
MKRLSNALLLFILIYGCASENDKKVVENKLLFTKLDAQQTNITFNNALVETDSLNYFTYTSIYMGGGISVGDINNDGLSDLFFTGNQVENKLYLNKGDLQFEDIAVQSNLQGDDRWYTGTTMVDINNDGYLDIYCSVAGKKGNKKNQLFINNQNNTFTEAAEKYGLADEGNSIQATFFDYDNDGDVDMYLANYPIAHPSTSNMVYKNRMENVNTIESDKLYRNDGETFTDVSEAAGVQNYSFSIGIAAADLNNDGWLDIYVSNDYSIPDFMYINNQDGTFTEVIKEATNQTAFYGMGVDIADINNDGFLDIFQADMDADNNRRQKANMASMNPRLFYETVLYGFHYQYMHNCLQLNSGFMENGVPKFANISRLTGTSSTDWSWAPLFADFDNDSHKDLFVSNGTRKEINNKDFFKKIGKKEYDELSLVEKSAQIPSEKIDNFMFKNLGGLEFKKANQDWGIAHKGFSNGAVYADLDNDGDLEIILNNIDEEAVIFKNNASNNYLKIQLQGTEKNKHGLGSRVTIYVDGKQQVQELTLTRGFQSSVAPELHFGLNKATQIDSLKVIWNDGNSYTQKNIKTNQTLVLNHTTTVTSSVHIERSRNEHLFTTNTPLSKTIKHFENDHDDFATQVLLPHKMSTLGPATATADVNNDGLEDIFLGGSFGLTSTLYLQTTAGFKPQKRADFDADKISEDVGALFFDPDQDGDQDLYVVSGGYEFANNSNFLKDRLYINDGKGNFQKNENALPDTKISGSRAYTLDYNKDGKQDILVLGRQTPGKYPFPTSSYLLENKSSKDAVQFEDNTKKVSPSLEGIGMATSAIITDFNNDSWEDILLVGEWMPITILQNNQGVFENITETMNLQETTGWWWSIQQGDFDNDGDLDYLIGNNGLNYKYKATEDETFDIYVEDFDKNQKEDIVLSYYDDGEQYPVRGRQCSSQQVPGIKQKFKNYDEYATATLIDVYGKKNLENALHYQIKSFASIYLENTENGFKIHELPIEVQFSSINQILVDDYDNDGNLDALVAGNLYNSEVETPRNDASYGAFLKGDGNGNFQAIPVTQSGFYTSGDVKDLQQITIGNASYILSIKNNDYIQFIKHNNKRKL